MNAKPQVGATHKSALAEIFRLHGEVGAFARKNLILLWIVMVLLVWIYNPVKALPYPHEVWHAISLN